MKKELKVIRIPIPTPTLFPHTSTNSYLVGNEEECLLVDAGYDQEETLTMLDQAIAEHGLAVPQRIVITHFHPDHAPGVKRLLDWNPTVYCHRDEKDKVLAAIAPFQEVSLFTDGDVLKIGEEEIKVLHTPGHTPGHLSLYLPSSRILITGDNIVAEGTTWIGPPDGDMTDYIRSLKRLQTLDVAKIAPGHGAWVLNPYEQIEFVLTRRAFRETQIVSLLQEHTQLTANELTKLIYENKIHPSVFSVAQLTIEAHLLKLIKEDVVTFEDPNYSFVS